MDLPRIDVYARTFARLLHANAPRIARNLAALDIDVRLFLVEWFITLFSSAVSIDLAARIMDWFVLDGSVVLFRVGVAIIIALEDKLAGGGYDTCLVTLTHLDDVPFDEDKVLETAARVVIPPHAMDDVRAIEDTSDM
jgi:hypothetical protein